MTADLENDPTVGLRRRMLTNGTVKQALEKNRGETWNTEALTSDFEVLAYAAPFVVVKRRRDGLMGSLMFTHQPRVYFGFVSYDEDDGT